MIFRYDSTEDDANNKFSTNFFLNINININITFARGHCSCFIFHSLSSHFHRIFMILYLTCYSFYSFTFYISFSFTSIYTCCFSFYFILFDLICFDWCVSVCLLFKFQTKFSHYSLFFFLCSKSTQKSQNFFFLLFVTFKNLL